MIPGLHPLALAYLQAEADDEGFHRAIIESGTGWGKEERAAYRPIEGRRIAAHRAWIAEGCPIAQDSAIVFCGGEPPPWERENDDCDGEMIEEGEHDANDDDCDGLTLDPDPSDLQSSTRTP